VEKELKETSEESKTLELNTSASKKHMDSRLNNLIKAVVFVILFFMILIPLTYMLRTSGDVKNRFEGFYAEPDNSLDIVLIGSSPTYSSVSTPMLYGEYGIKAYPLASNVQRPAAGVHLLAESEKSQSPTLYMFEIRMYSSLEVGLQNNIAYTRGVTDNMKYSVNRIKTINDLITEGYMGDGDKYTYYFDIFKYHSNWTSLRLLSQLQSFRYEKKDPLKGTLVSDKVGPADKPIILDDPEPLAIEPLQEEALNNLFLYLKEHNLQALFYLSPYALTEEEQQKFAYIKDRVLAAGFDYLDMNQYYDEIGIDFSKDYSDYGIHTNAVGEYKCTVFLGEYLKVNYNLGNNPNNEDKSWDEAYDLWLETYSASSEMIDTRVENQDWNVLTEE